MSRRDPRNRRTRLEDRRSVCWENAEHMLDFADWVAVDRYVNAALTGERVHKGGYAADKLAAIVRLVRRHGFTTSRISAAFGWSGTYARRAYEFASTSP